MSSGGYLEAETPHLESQCLSKGALTSVFGSLLLFLVYQIKDLKKGRSAAVVVQC